MNRAADLNVDQLLAAISADLREHLQEAGIHRPLMIGIHTGGVWIAQRLHRALGLEEPLGTLNISFYRDDFSRIGVHPQVTPSTLPVTTENRHIVLVDDVLQTGRTVRAALNEIFDYGRPASVTLVVLVDLPGRELPFEAAVSGAHLELEPGQQVKLEGPEPLRLAIRGQAA